MPECDRLRKALEKNDELRHQIRVLELEKAQYKLKAKTYGVKLTWLERQCKRIRKEAGEQ